MGTLRIYCFVILIFMCFVNRTVYCKKQTFRNHNNARTFSSKNNNNKVAPIIAAGPERDTEFGTRGKSKCRFLNISANK